MKRIIIICVFCAIGYTVDALPIQYGKTVTINQPVFEDLYITAGTVIINAPIHGDLIVAGGTININDSVTNDILVAGGNVTFNGYVGDDIRCAGGNLHISKNVTGDVVIAGGTLTIDKGVAIGNLITSTGEIRVDGNVTGNIKSMSGNLVLNGTVLKNMDCRGGKIVINGNVNGQSILASNDKIVIGNSAVFGDDVRYWVPNKTVDFKKSLQGGLATYDPSLKINYGRWYFLGFASLIGLLWYTGMVLLCIIMLQYLFAPTLKRAGETVYNSRWKSLGYGLLFWIGVPVAAVFAFITLIGVPVGLILVFSYIVLAVLATVITSSVAANWLNNRSNTQWRFWQLVFTSFGIFIVLKILSLTPFFGWLVLALSVCMAFGAIILNIDWRRKKQATDNKKRFPVSKGLVT